MAAQNAFGILAEVDEQQTDRFAEQRIRPGRTHRVCEESPPIKCVVLAPHRHGHQVDAEMHACQVRRPQRNVGQLRIKARERVVRHEPVGVDDQSTRFQFRNQEFAEGFHGRRLLFGMEYRVKPQRARKLSVDENADVVNIVSFIESIFQFLRVIGRNRAFFQVRIVAQPQYSLELAFPFHASILNMFEQVLDPFGESLRRFHPGLNIAF